MTETRIHPETGKTLRRGVRPQTVKFGSMTRVADLPGWYPDDDSDSVHSGADLAESDRVFQELKAAQERPKAPVKEVFTNGKRPLFIVMFMTVGISAHHGCQEGRVLD